MVPWWQSLSHAVPCVPNRSNAEGAFVHKDIRDVY